MKTFFLSYVLCASVVNVSAMDRFEALSQIESGDNDLARGRAGEVSRYQIMPAVWQQYTLQPLSSATNAAAAEIVAKVIMADRLPESGKVTDRQFYLLWHCPARVNHPTKADAARAQRFANLCSKQ